MSFIKKWIRYDFILMIIILVVLMILWQEHLNNSNGCINTLETLKTQGERQTRLVSDFLHKNQLSSLFDTSHENSYHKETADTRLNFYKRCFSRPAVNGSKKDSFDHPLFTGFVIENKDLCSSAERVDVLVYINSAVQNRQRRRAIRHSWASQNAFTGVTIRLVFILGQPASRREQLEIFSEHASSGDIVQAKFEDTFRNLTFKAVTFMAWANAHCAQAQYVVKVDDDMFVDMFAVIFKIIPKMADKSYAMACSYTKHGKISRNPKSNWYVGKTLLAGQTHYPGFCPGFFSVITGNIIPELYEGSFAVKDHIPIDDVYMTSLSLRNPENVSIIDIIDQLYPNERSDPDQEIKVNGHFEYIAFRVKEERQHMALWNLRLDKVSSLEESFSSFTHRFAVYEKQSVVIKK